MDAFPISILGHEYMVFPKECGKAMQYIVQVNGQDVIFQINDAGDLAPLEEANPVELLAQVGRAIETHFL